MAEIATTPVTGGIWGGIGALAGPVFDYAKSLDRKGMDKQIALAEAQAKIAQANADQQAAVTGGKIDPKMIMIAVIVLFVIILILYALNRKNGN